MKVKDIIATTYVLLDNADEEELDMSVALEMFGSTISMMKYEQLFGNLDDVIRKAQVTFSDSTGVVTNSLTDFGDVVYLKFNNDYIDECPVSMLQLYEDSGLQRIAFWTDASTNTSYIQQSIPQMGVLDVWYEPYETIEQTFESDLDFHESLRWCVATRLAINCLHYVKYKDQYKMANKANLDRTIRDLADNWRRIYLEKVNRIGTNKPFQRLPFMAGVTSE